MEIRQAASADLDEILSIYAHARRFMAANGNAGQWGNGYPAQALLMEDIRRGKLYVCPAESRIAGVFYFAQEEDPTYRVIEDGAWRSDAPSVSYTHLDVYKRQACSWARSRRWATAAAR